MAISRVDLILLYTTAGNLLSRIIAPVLPPKFYVKARTYPRARKYKRAPHSCRKKRSSEPVRKSRATVAAMP